MSNYYAALLLTLALITVGGCDQTTQNVNEKIIKRVDDSVITAKVKAAIQAAPALKLTEINVETDNGVVQITSVVKSQSDVTDMSRAIELASRVEGVAYVRPEVQINAKVGSNE